MNILQDYKNNKEHEEQAKRDLQISISLASITVFLLGNTLTLLLVVGICVPTVKQVLIVLPVFVSVLLSYAIEFWLKRRW